jgi:hypothetical protein
MVAYQFAVPYAPTAPDFMDAIVDLFTAAHEEAGTDVVVKDGPWVTKESATSIIAVGFSGFFPRYERPGTATGEQFGMADLSSNVFQEGLGPSLKETHVLTCASLVRVGDTRAMRQARREAYENIRICATGISPTHGRWPGGLENLIIGSSSTLSQTQDHSGILAMVMFSVSGETTAQQ